MKDKFGTIVRSCQKRVSAVCGAIMEAKRKVDENTTK